MTTLRFATICIAAAGYVLGGSDLHAQTVRSVDFASGSAAGQIMPGLQINNSPCLYGDHFWFEIDSNGSLGLKGPITCGNGVHAAGGQQICFLNTEFRCTSDKVAVLSPHAVIYRVTDVGVIVEDIGTYPWAEREAAIALRPTIEAKAIGRCEEVLHFEVAELHYGKYTPPTERKVREDACQPLVERLCAANRDGSVKLTSGTDITPLCQRMHNFRSAN
jgi:hypothetical protein